MTLRSSRSLNQALHLLRSSSPSGLFTLTSSLAVGLAVEPSGGTPLAGPDSDLSCWPSLTQPPSGERRYLSLRAEYSARDLSSSLTVAAEVDDDGPVGEGSSPKKYCLGDKVVQSTQLEYDTSHKLS